MAAPGSVTADLVEATTVEAEWDGTEPAAVGRFVASSETFDPERRLAALARAGGPLRRVVAALAGRLAQRRGWERLGYARVGDYARERLGLSGRSLYALARVDRKLAELPRLEAALVSGRLSWSKVRLVAGVGASEDEGRWVVYAQRVGVRALARDVRAVNRGSLEAGAEDGDADEEATDVEATERLSIRGPASLCFKWQRAREYAARTAGERLSPGAVLELVTAEALSSLALDPSADREACEGTSWSDAVGASAAGSADDDLTERASQSSRDEPAADVCTTQGSEQDVAPPGAAPPRAELPPSLRPLVEGLDAADSFELDARLRRAVRLEQRLEAQIAPLLRQVTASEYAWRFRYQTLAAYARERLGMSPRKARALLQLEPPGAVGEGSDERQVCAQPSDPGTDLEAGWRITVSAPKAVARLFRAVLCSVRLGLEREAGKLPTEAEGFEAMLDHALRSWDVTDPWLRRRMKREYAAFERDGWRCTVPGCTAPGALWFELGVRAGRAPLACYRSAERVA